MKKVYVVSFGEYSDKSVYAVFSSKEKAEEYGLFKASLYSEQCCIEEFNLDEEVMLPKTMRAAFVYIKDGSEYVGGASNICTSIDFSTGEKTHTTDFSKKLISGHGKSYSKALKAARDNRAKLLAEQAGIA
jgi:hypothetical protein